MEFDNSLSDFEVVCRDNYRLLRDNSECYIYIKPVLDRTIELCESNNIRFKVIDRKDYWCLYGIDNVFEKGRRKKDGEEN